MLLDLGAFPPAVTPGHDHMRTTRPGLHSLGQPVISSFPTLDRAAPLQGAAAALASFLAS
jgi:hypothetical protein